jgi:hypothetical protein
MNKAAMMALAALVLVAGCNSGSTESAEGNGGNGAASAAPVEGTAVTRETLIGAWGQNNCTNLMTFAADGTTTSTSSQQGASRWSIESGTIVITSPGGEDIRMPATIANGELHLNGGGGEGQTTTLSRCPDAAGGNNAAAAEGGNEAAEEADE